jgi:hypothetical protein
MSFSTRASGPVLLVVLATGCGRNYLVGFEGDRTPPPSASGTDGGPIIGVSDPSPETVAAACAAPLGDPLWINSIPELRAAMLGRWFRCPPTPTPDSDGGIYPIYAFGGLLGGPVEAGIELDDDAKFRLFDWGNGNTVVPRPGLLNGGTYVFLVTSTNNSGHPYVQLNFDWDSGAASYTVPVLSDVPRVLLLAQYQFIAETR